MSFASYAIAPNKTTQYTHTICNLLVVVGFSRAVGSLLFVLFCCCCCGKVGNAFEKSIDAPKKNRYSISTAFFFISFYFVLLGNFLYPSCVCMCFSTIEIHFIIFTFAFSFTPCTLQNKKSKHSMPYFAHTWFNMLFSCVFICFFYS